MPTLDPRVDAYIAKAPAYAQPLLAQVRAVVHQACPDVVEGIKWSMPHFMYGGRNLLHLAAFKQHLSLGIWYGEAAEVAREPGQPMGNFGRITAPSELPTKARLTRLIRSGMAAIDSGETRRGSQKAAPRPAPEVPPDLAKALKGQPAARAFFESLPPSAQREYTEWLTEAKREETRQRRLEQTVAQLAEGKRRYWKQQPQRLD